MRSDSMHGICLRPALPLLLVKTRKSFPSSSFFIFILFCSFCGFQHQTQKQIGHELLIQLAHLVLFEGLASCIFSARLRGRDEIRILSSTNGTSGLPDQLLPIMYVATPHAFISSTSTLATLKGCFTHSILHVIFADGYDPMDPNGNITIKWDVLEWSGDNAYSVGFEEEHSASKLYHL